MNSLQVIYIIVITALNLSLALTLQAASMSVFESSHSPPHRHNSNEVHQYCQPKSTSFQLIQWQNHNQQQWIARLIQEKVAVNWEHHAIPSSFLLVKS